MFLLSIKKNKKTKQKQRREIHTCNSVDGRFDKAWMVGLTKHSNMDFTNYERRRIVGNGGENWLE